ncbi:MAG: TolC family protein [Rubritepida sp.]|jgi:outer membrane protein TolC|nr:TolC family protein [Rubritepida sp.]MCU0944268.1 TolC family protein [Rubritepida sp.]
MHRFLTILLAALLLAPQPAAAQESLLARHLEAALSLDAGFRALEAQRAAVAARGAAVRTPIAGSPSLGGSFRSDTRGPNQQYEFDAEVAAPVWLPGQRGALRGTVESAVSEVEQRLALRRLEVAGLLRDAWWNAAEARRAAQLARERLTTAREIERDVARRARLGDIPPTEALLARNETLGAEVALTQADAEAAAAEAAYRTLTGGLAPNLPPESVRPRAQAGPHPVLRAGEAALATAEARQRLVAATPRDNPELGFFGRQEGGSTTTEATSLGIRLRVPLATEARNLPRRAEAESEITRATAELAQSRRQVEAAIARAQAQLRAAEATARVARERLRVAREQEAIALAAFRAGETGAFDLFRVRQLRLDAANEEGRAAVEALRARSLVNQALGILP